MNGVDYSASIYGLFGVIVHATISGRRRLQDLVLSFMPRYVNDVDYSASIYGLFGVIVHAMISGRRRLQDLVLSFMPR